MSLLQQYDYKIRYKPRKGMLTANTLSRGYIKDCEHSPPEVEVERPHTYHYLPDNYFKDIQTERETTCPSALQSLKNTISEGFLVAKVRLNS